MKKINFGTGGFRGVIGDDFTKENVQKIAQALSEIIKKRKQDNFPVIIGYDNRFMSDYYAKWFIEVINGNNISTLLFPFPVPTPVVMSSLRDRGYFFGAMITASHNPYYFNGIKIFTKEGMDADVNFTNELEEEINNVTSINITNELIAREKGLFFDYTNLHSYINHIKSFVDTSLDGSSLKIIYNNMNGVGYIGFEALKDIFNISKFDIINETHDAFFGFNLPNPTKEALSGEFADKVVKNHYDLGLASDSDGDRLGIIDEKGNYISANEILASIYYYLIKERGYSGDIVKNLATSNFVDLVAKHLGYECHEVDVGFKNITANIKKYNALLGGESSGGLTMQGYIYGKDASFAAALFLEMLIKYQKPASDIIKNIKEEVNYHKHTFEGFITLKVDPNKVLEEIEKNPPKFRLQIQKIVHYGRNFKYYLNDESWILIRLSGTEPAFRLFFELEDEKDISNEYSYLRKYIDDIQNKLK